MEHLLVAANVVMPLLLLMVTGALVKRAGFVEDDTLHKVDALSFKVFLPALVFNSIYNSDFRAGGYGRLVVFGTVCTLVIGAFGFLLAKRLKVSQKKAASMACAVTRTNVVLYGVAVLNNLYGEGSAAAVVVLSAVTVPVTNAMSVIFFEYFRGGKVSAKRVISGVARNPLILASAVGIVVALLGIRLPALLEGLLEDLASVATPLCLLTLGASISAKGLRTNARLVALGTALKMAILPAVFLGISVAAGFRNHDLAALMVQFGAPTAISSYTMANQMGADGELSSAMIAVTTTASILTIFMITFLFNACGLV